MTTLVNSSAYRSDLGTGTPDAKSWFRGDGTWNYTLDISNAAGGQIVFPSTQNASANVNTLDDYREGTWTPTLTGSTSNPTVTYSTQNGKYTKIGNIIVFSARIVTSAFSGGSGALQVSSLPYATAIQSSISVANSSGFTTLYPNNGQITLSPGTDIILYSQNGTSLPATIIIGTNTNAVMGLTISGVYLV